MTDFSVLLVIPPYGVTWEEKDLKPWEDWEENE